MLRKLWPFAGSLLAGFLFTGLAIAQDDNLIGADADIPEGVEVLTRGPIHEAFASPVTGEVEAGLVVSMEPPENVDEVPPEYRPEGDDVIWIPGYWAWEEERKDFIWISGVWRRLPPGHRWVPGYWSRVDRGWQWVSGFWSPEAEEQVTYYDPPPATLEEGPTSEAPGDNYFWSPGCWYYYETGYRWRPGFWARSHTDWLWMPDRWVWTPSGAVFCRGYWDFQMSNRGSCFTPVYFERTVYRQPNFVWTPRFALNPAALVVNFWIRPNYSHYYFGNYYSGYDRLGYVPISTWHTRRSGWNWDPIVAYNESYYRGQGINYSRRLSQWHDFYVDNPDRRPPNTWREQVNVIRQQNVTVNSITKITNITNVVNNDIDIVGRGGNVNLISSNVMALPINQVARATRNDRDSGFRFAEVDRGQREQARDFGRELREVNRVRAEAEVKNRVAARDNDQPDRRNPRDAQQRTSLRLPAMKKNPNATAQNTNRNDNTDAERTPSRNTVGRTPPDRPDRRPGADDRIGASDRPGADDRTTRPGVDDRPGRTAGNERPGAVDRAARPGVERPGADRPGTERPGADRPSTGRAGSDRPGVDRPGVDRPSTDRPGTPRPSTDRPGADRSSTDRPGATRPSIDRPGTPRPSTDRPGADRPGVNRPGIDSPSTARPGTDRPSADRPSADRPSTDPTRALRPNLDRPGMDRPGGVDRPSADRPATRPGLDRPGSDRPSTERPGASPGSDRPRLGTERPGNLGGSRPSAVQSGAVRPGATRPEARPTPRVERPKASRPEPRQERPEPRTAFRPPSRPEVGGARPDPRPQARPEPRPQVRPEPRPQARPEPRPQARPEPRAERPDPRSSGADRGGRPSASGSDRTRPESPTDPRDKSKGKGRDRD
jgi:hypothetical protein